MPSSRRMLVVNQSKLVTDADVRKMVAAVNVQCRDHVPAAWGIARLVVRFAAGMTLADAQAASPPGTYVLTLLDEPDQAGALGWHDKDAQDRVYGEFFAKPCLDAGSTALDGVYAISSVLSHEAVETQCNPNVNAFMDTGRGYLIATEGSDPVEADGYKIGGVQVSDFVTPEWFDPVASKGERFDWLGLLSAPLTMRPGGYWIQMAAGNETQQFKRTRAWMDEVGFDVRRKGAHQLVFSPEMPEWRRELKLAHGRLARATA